MNRDPRGNDNRARETRINERIRAREIRLIGEDGEMIGVMAPMRALEMAREKNLDLVEISPQANPPVCKLMDYGRYKYEQSKKESEVRKRQKVVKVKEIRMYPHTDSGDVKIKIKKISEFLEDGDKVKVIIQFKGREIFHPEIGRKMAEDILEALKSIAQVERPPILEGRSLTMQLGRQPGWTPAKKNEEEAAAQPVATATPAPQVAPDAEPPAAPQA